MPLMPLFQVTRAEVTSYSVIWQLTRIMKEINVIHIISEVPRVDLKRRITKMMVISFLFELHSGTDPTV